MHPAASRDYRMGVDWLVQAVNQRGFPGGGECANTRTEVQQDESLPQLNTVTTLLEGSKADGLKQAGFRVMHAERVSAGASGPAGRFVWLHQHNSLNCSKRC